MDTTITTIDVAAHDRLHRLLRSAADAERIVVASGSSTGLLNGVGLSLVEHASATGQRLRTLLNDVDESVDDGATWLVCSLRESPRSFVRFLRHGVELVHAVQSSAREAKDAAVDGFCDVWLTARAALIDQLDVDLDTTAEA